MDVNTRTGTGICTYICMHLLVCMRWGLYRGATFSSAPKEM